MLKKLIDVVRRKGISSTRHMALTKTINNYPIYAFSSKPPKGFDKFKRKSREGKVDEKSVETNEGEEVKKKTESSHESEKASQRIDIPKSTLNPEKSKESSSNNKEDAKKSENKSKNQKQEEEERIEEEEEESSSKNQKKKKEKFPYNLFGEKQSKEIREYLEKMFKDPKFKYAVAAIIFSLIILDTIYNYYEDYTIISHDDLIRQYLENDMIRKVVIKRMSQGSGYKTLAMVETKDNKKYGVYLGNVEVFIAEVEEFQKSKSIPKDMFIPIEFDYKVDANKVLERFVDFGYVAGAFLFLFLMLRQLKGAGGAGGRGGVGGGDIMSMSKSQVKIYGIDSKISTRFKDVAGLDEAKLEITEFVDFLKKPKKFKDLGAKIPRGALLAGPPGTGKTLLGKAAAGEAGVPFLYVSGSEFVEMFVGVGASRVRDLFKKAKDHAPAIIFIDEIDAIGRKRESRLGGSDERDNTLNQLLVEMDGFGTDANVIVFAATNRKELLDPALTRPGRFDRTVEVNLPDIEGRKDIFMVHLKPIKLDPSKTIEEYARRLSTLTPGFSGADISNLCNEAAILAARKNKKFVESSDFESASERILAGLEKKRIVSEDERKVVAVHESGHAVVSWFLEGGNPLLKLTIIPRSKGSLGFAQYLPNENNIETRRELLDRICCILGGRCSEELFNGRVTTGAYDDLKKAYDIAYAMITKFGMSDKIGNIGFADPEYVRKHSDETSMLIDEEVKRILDLCSERTREIVRKHRNEIEKLSAALLEKETLDLQGIVAVLGERPFAPKSNFKAYLEVRKEDQKQENQTEENKDESKESEKKISESPTA